MSSVSCETQCLHRNLEESLAAQRLFPQNSVAVYICLWLSSQLWWIIISTWLIWKGSPEGFYLVSMVNSQLLMHTYTWSDSILLYQSTARITDLLAPYSWAFQMYLIAAGLTAFSEPLHCKGTVSVDFPLFCYVLGEEKWCILLFCMWTFVARQGLFTFHNYLKPLPVLNWEVFSG